ELLNPHGAAFGPRGIDLLAEYLEAHVLEDLQRDVERDALAGRERREAQPPALPGRLVQRHLARAFAVRDAGDLRQVLAGALGGNFLAITRGEAVRETVVERKRLVLGQLLEQFLAQLVLP